MSWCVYILQCSDNTLYTGITNDLDKRLKQHNLGKGARYTASRLPVTLLWQQGIKDKSTALKREIEIKKFSRHQKLQLCL